MTLVASPVSEQAEDLVSGARRRRRSPDIGAGEHAGAAAAQASGSMPASSSASHAHSSSSRCCGSIASASRGEIPKKLGVELGRVVDEAALAHVARPRPLRVRVVEPLEIPAAIEGTRRSRRRAEATSSHRSSGDRTPPGIAAAHPDDRDRLVHRPRDRRRRDRRRGGPRPGRAGTWRRRRRRVVEDEGRGQRQPGRRGEPVAQLDRRASRSRAP